MKKLLALLLFVPVIVSATPDKGTLFSSAPLKAGLNAAPIKNEETGLNYFENAVENQVINNSVWYETPKFRKTLAEQQNYESFATKELAKETMVKVLNEELNYEHTFTRTYSKTDGFGTIFDGVNKYASFFVPETSWIPLESRCQKLNVSGINDYDFIDNKTYLVHILAEYTCSTSPVTTNIYVFVEKEIGGSENPKYLNQINAFIAQQAENLIRERTVFNDSFTRNTPAPIFADPDFAPEENPVFSDLRVVQSSNDEQTRRIKSKDGSYYSYAHYNEYNGFESAPDYNVPETTLLTARDLWSLTNQINEDGTRIYHHYICQQSNSSARTENWKKLIKLEDTTSGHIYTDFAENTFPDVVGGRTDISLTINGASFKENDLKLHFYTNDKVWTKVKIEHTDFPELVDEDSLTNSCHWNFNENDKIELNSFDDNVFVFKNLNAKYTFYSVNSLGEYNSFSFTIKGARAEDGEIEFLNGTKRTGIIANDNSGFNVDVHINNLRLAQNKFKIVGLTGSLNIGEPEIHKGEYTRFPVTIKSFTENHFASFTIQYEGSASETTCVYYLYNKLSNKQNVLKDVLKFHNDRYEVKFPEDKRVESSYVVTCTVPDNVSSILEIKGEKYTLTAENTLSKYNQEVPFIEKSEVIYKVGEHPVNTYSVLYSLKESNELIATELDQKVFAVSAKSGYSFEYNGMSKDNFSAIYSFDKETENPKYSVVAELFDETEEGKHDPAKLEEGDLEYIEFKSADKDLLIKNARIEDGKLKFDIVPGFEVTHCKKVKFEIIYKYKDQGEVFDVTDDELELFFCVEDGEDVYNVIEERGLTNCFSAAEELNTDGWQNEERTITGKGLVTFTVPEGGKTADGMQYSYRAYYKNNIGVETEIENSRSFEPSDNEYEIIIKQEFIDKNNASHVCEGKFFIKVDEATQPVPPGPGPTPTPGGGGGLSAGVLGGIIGGVVGLLAIVVVIIIVRIRKKQSLKKR